MRPRRCPLVSGRRAGRHRCRALRALLHAASRCSGSIAWTTPRRPSHRWPSQKVEGYLPEAAALRQAEVRETRGDYTGAEQIYEGLVQRTLASPQTVMAEARHDGRDERASRPRARGVQLRARDTFPLTQEATEAELGLDRIKGFDLAHAGRRREGARPRRHALQRAPDRSGAERVRAACAVTSAATITIWSRCGSRPSTRRAARPAPRARRCAATSAIRGYGEDAQFALLGDHARPWRQRRVPVARPCVCHPVPCRLVHRRRPERSGQTLRARRRGRARRPRSTAKWWTSFRAAATPNGPRGRPAGGRIARTTSARPCGSSRRAPRRFRDPITVPSWLYWSARAYDGLGDRAAATERFRLAATDYLNTYYGRLAWDALEERNEATRHARRAPGRGAAARRAAEHRSDRAPDRAGALSSGARRAAARAEDPRRLGAAAGDDRARAAPDREPAARHQRDEARLSAVHDGRRREPADRDSPGASSRSITGRCSSTTRARTTSIRTWSPRSSDRNPPSMRRSCRRPTRSA